MSIGEGSLRKADIVVSTTAAGVSRGIRAGTGASVSHAMLYTGNLQVVEAIGEGVVSRALAMAKHDATLAIVLRRRNLSQAKANEVVAHALGFKDRPYDVIGAVGSGATLGRGKLFAGVGCLIALRTCGVASAEVLRNASATERDKAFFCSELVARAFELAGVPIVEGSASFASPRAVRISPHLYYVGKLVG
jgi:uncharacterized protein YycO